MSGFFKKNQHGEQKSENGIRIIKQTRPGECGGTDATLDEKAPKVISSTKMIRFEADSALHGDYLPLSKPPVPGETVDLEYLGYFSAFAAPAKDGFFLYLETAEGFRGGSAHRAGWAYVKEDIFPLLVALVNDCAIAKQNGYHSKTHGLPANFGGSALILYESGEKISFSDNQTPVFTFEAAKRIVGIFRTAMEGEKVSLPEVSALKEIRFEENRKNGGYTRAVLTLTENGGVNRKESRYDGPTVYQSEKEVSAETVAAMKENIEKTGVFAWSGLPQNDYRFKEAKTLTFVFEDGGEIAVTDDRVVPDGIRRGFFNIELEMTTKH